MTCTIPALVAALQVVLLADLPTNGPETSLSICTPCSCPSAEHPGACNRYIADEMDRRAAGQREARELIAACTKPAVDQDSTIEIPDLASDLDLGLWLGFDSLVIPLSDSEETIMLPSPAEQGTLVVPCASPEDLWGRWWRAVTRETDVRSTK